jgi:hypothetical protein
MTGPEPSPILAHSNHARRRNSEKVSAEVLEPFHRRRNGNRCQWLRRMGLKTIVLDNRKTLSSSSPSLRSGAWLSMGRPCAPARTPDRCRSGSLPSRSRIRHFCNTCLDNASYRHPSSQEEEQGARRNAKAISSRREQGASDLSHGTWIAPLFSSDSKPLATAS